MTKMIKGRGYNVPNEVGLILLNHNSCGYILPSSYGFFPLFHFLSTFQFPYLSLCISKVIRTFLSLQLHSVEEPVNQMGVASNTTKSKEQKVKRKMETKKMTRKQRRVRWNEKV